MYRYGAPPSVRSLTALLMEEAKKDRWETYVADMLCLNARLKARKGSTIPMYSEIVGMRSQRDTRTGQEIIDSLAAKFDKFIRGG